MPDVPTSYTPPDTGHIAEDIAAGLLAIGAVKLSPEAPFTWASGWKAPIYCDNRLTLSYPALRSRITAAFCIAALELAEQPDIICGVATGGLPQAAMVAHHMGLPMNYVRPKPKGHGLQNQVEGLIEPGAKIVVIEDLVSTGGSSLKAVAALREAGMEVISLMAVFTYGFVASAQAFEDARLPFHALSNFEQLERVALKEGLISEAHRQALAAWRTSPATWGQ